MKFSLWLHCAAQIVLVAAVTFYFAHFQRYYEHALHTTIMPLGTYYPVHGRNWLWLVPAAFCVTAARMSFKPLAGEAVALFSACSTLLVVSIISIALFATCLPFVIPAEIISPP